VLSEKSGRPVLLFCLEIQSAAVISEAETAAYAISVRLILSVHLFACQNSAVKVYGLRASSGEAYLAPNEDQTVKVESAIHIKIAIYDQDA